MSEEVRCPDCGAIMLEADGLVPSPGSLDVASSGKYWTCPECGTAIKA